MKEIKKYEKPVEVITDRTIRAAIASLQGDDLTAGYLRATPVEYEVVDPKLLENK